MPFAVWLTNLAGAECIGRDAQSGSRQVKQPSGSKLNGKICASGCKKIQHLIFSTPRTGMAKKKYSIQWENDTAVAFEINGKVYKSLEEIQNPKELQKMMAILAAAEDDETDSQPEKPPFPFENIILAAFTGIAVIMFLIAGFSSASAIGTMQKQKSAPGVVVNVIVRREYVNEQDHITQDYYYPVVDFTAEDGHRRSVQMNVGSDSPEYEKGNEVTVLYDPQHPLDANIKSFGSAAVLWILPAITGILGLSFLTAVIAVRVVMFRSENPAIQTPSA
jgi:hypothetical protein